MGIPTLISTSTSSGASAINITSGITSAYDEYMFVYTDINPSSGGHWAFQCSTDGGSNYNTTLTSTLFLAYFDEAGSATTLAYNTAHDEAQSTDPQSLNVGTGAESDESAAGILHLFNPASTTYVKHFYARTQTYQDNDYATDAFAAGYFNTTSAINAIQFAFQHSANAFDGVVQMYGIS